MNNTSEIQKLKELHDSGALTDEEFVQMKQRILNGTGAQSSSKMSVFAIIAFVLSILTPLWPVTLILCCVALSQINKSEGHLGGKGLAVAGIVISSIGSILILLVVAVGSVFFVTVTVPKAQKAEIDKVLTELSLDANEKSHVASAGHGSGDGHGSEDGHGRNVAIGRSALETLNAGADAYNVAIGYNAGIFVSTGTNR